MKKFIVVLLTLAMLLAMSACGSGGSAQQPTQSTATEAPTVNKNAGAFDNYVRPVVKDKLKVGYLHTLASFSSTNRSIRQMQIECAHRGWEYVDGQYETDDQIRDVWNALLNAGCDAICVQGTGNFSTYSDMIEKTRNAGAGIYSTETAMAEGSICTVMLAGGVASMEMAYELGRMTNFNANVCVATAQGAQQHIERTKVFEGLLDGVFGTFVLLDSQDMGGPDESASNCYDTTLAWVQQYGDDLDMIYCSCDAFAQIAAEALTAAGYGDKGIITAGIDGDSTTFPALTSGGPFKLSYMQPSELFVHTMAEVVNDIQCLGLNPGDEGCHIPSAGYQFYLTGNIVTADDIPASGTPVHALFSYYTSPDADEWYNWEAPSGTEVYVIEY